MEGVGHLLLAAHDLYARAEPSDEHTKTPRHKNDKAIGISLALASGLFIGTSFVLKKVGLLKANVKYNEEAGEGYGYLKNFHWWTGMTLMIVGEIFNVVAYAFVDAILVTPLGALSVVITTILSAIFLKERLSFVGKVGCFMCIVGSVVIAMNAPSENSVLSIQTMKNFVIAPGFLSYAGVIIVTCIFIALWAGPRYGKKSMLVYLSICSLIGGLSVVATQGVGAAVLAQARGQAQFNQWFLYVLLVFVAATLVTEIIFLNKALNIFNAALVTPTYYVFFTSATIITSTVLFRGFKGTPTSIITVVMGFLQICAGVVLLQLSKSAKDVPDAAVFKGDLDQVRTVAEQEEPEFEPKADAIRGTAAIIRRFSNSRQMKEAAEAKRIHEDRLKDQMEPIGEEEQIEWDGLRRRRTLRNGPGLGAQRKKTVHPPLGLTHFPEAEDDEGQDVQPEANRKDDHDSFNGGFMSSFKRRAMGTFSRNSTRIGSNGSSGTEVPNSSMAMTDVTLPIYEHETNARREHHHPASDETAASHVFGLPPGLHRLGHDGAMDPARLSPEPLNKELEWEGSEGGHRLGPSPPPHMAKRQFSFQNVFHRRRSDKETETTHGVRPPSSRAGIGSRSGIRSDPTKSGTEEERAGLVRGDSNAILPLPDYISEDENNPQGVEHDHHHSHQRGSARGSGLKTEENIRDENNEKDESLVAEKAIEQDSDLQQQWIDSGISPHRPHHSLDHNTPTRPLLPSSRSEGKRGANDDDNKSTKGGNKGRAFL